MILNTIAEVANQYKIYRPNMGFYAASNQLNAVKEADRIIWFPTTDDFDGTLNIGHNANQVTTRLAGVDFYIYSRDWNKIEDYVNDLVISIYDKVHGPMFEILGGEWISQGTQDEQGFCYRLSVQFSSIIIKRPLRTAEIEHTEGRTHFDGSSEYVP